MTMNPTPAVGPAKEGLLKQFLEAPVEVITRIFEHLHRHGDTDQDRNSHHHTLGIRPTQAAPGNHEHLYEYAPITHAPDTPFATPKAGWNIIEQFWMVNPTVRVFMGEIYIQRTGASIPVGGNFDIFPNLAIAQFDKTQFNLVRHVPGWTGTVGRLGSGYMNTAGDIYLSAYQAASIDPGHAFRMYFTGFMSAYYDKVTGTVKVSAPSNVR